MGITTRIFLVMELDSLELAGLVTEYAKRKMVTRQQRKLADTTLTA